MSKKKNKLVPELRFPEFKNEGEWNIAPLRNLSDEIVEKTKGRKYKLMSITSGVGLVSQIEKFGREIAGDSYKNYYVIHKYDFAYNKSSTKIYGEGEIAMYEDEEMGAVPNSIFTCFRFFTNKIYPPFAKYPFINNIHGNWLNKFIAVGARANGALQVNSKDLFSLPFSYPSINEQKKIASFLFSLDEVIIVHNEKLEQLKAYKKGLLQNLFPQEGEKVPKLRFKEFKGDGDWVEKNDCVKILSGVSYKMSEYSPKGVRLVQGTNIYNGYYSDDNTIFIDDKTNTQEHIIVNKGDILLGLNRPITNDELKVCLYPFDIGYLYQRAGILKYQDDIFRDFLYQFLCSPHFLKHLKKELVGSDQPYIKSNLFATNILITPPSFKEQQKIASCLSALDEIIKAQAELIEQLKLHKKGLIQSLFPQTID